MRGAPAAAPAWLRAPILGKRPDGPEREHHHAESSWIPANRCHAQLEGVRLGDVVT